MHVSNIYVFARVCMCACVHMCMCRYGLPSCGLDRIIITSSDEIFQVFSPCMAACVCVCVCVCVSVSV